MMQDKKAVILPLFGDTAMAQPSSSSGGGGGGGGRRDGIVLVSGATGGVGKRVVQARTLCCAACGALACCTSSEDLQPSWCMNACHTAAGAAVKGQSSARSCAGCGQSQAAAGECPDLVVYHTMQGTIVSYAEAFLRLRTACCAVTVTTRNKQHTCMFGSQGGLKGAPGSSLELLPADIVQPATLLPEMFEGVTAAVLATAAKVSPKEGDTPDRQKYMQVHAATRACQDSMTVAVWSA